MAMSRRPIGSGQGPRTATRPFYENFQPRTELREEDGATLLIVYLPGYLQHQISFSKDESTRLIRLSGERPILNNRRQRFNIAHKVPENYNFGEVKPQFQIGIFTLRMPKIITLPPKEQESKTAIDPLLTPKETNEKKIQTQQQKEETLAKDPLVGLQQGQSRQEASSTLEPRKETAISEKGPDKVPQKVTTPGDQSTNVVAGGDRWEVVEGKIKEISEKAVVDDHRRFMVNAGVAVVVIMALGAQMFSHFIGTSKKC